ncbi:zinc finger and BTB domain-containing protein 21 isoform X1 [Astyanax mexicanus]|uniref:Zinc finger and BTB domain-containing protein 21 isoform X1 n=2 Tax=Astyanax mexicanus TaxID=7994 RepID=A0A8T2KZW1_ASTMX|nr:zinc finger and BTB domain-containing protein 21 isoform X1 [Astyanax mexicanus]
MDVSELRRGATTRNARTRAEMESLVHYSSPAHAISLLGVLNDQRLRGHLCDVVLVVGENRFQAHRSVLAASSEYFQAVFSRTDSESRTVIHLDFCEPEAFEIVLNYIYSSSLFVDKCSLAVIQELGYSLGIPFLTNIMSTRPQVSYCVSRKRLSFSEEDDGTFQKRSVIVRQSGLGASHRISGSTLQGKAPKHTDGTSDETPPSQAFREQTHLSSGDMKPNEMGTFVPSVRSNANTQPEDGDTKPIVHNLPSILKGHEYRSHSGRPQLTSSVSFSESVQHASLHSADDKPEAEQVHDSKPVSGSQQGLPNHTIDRSGPLIKSLLRRSLSMDSPVPVFSPVLELKDSQSREQSVVKLASSKRAGSPPSESKHQMSRHVPPLILRSKEQNTLEKEGTQEAEVRIKTEPSSPLADPSEIIRITVGDNLPVNFKDFQGNFEESPRPYFSPLSKRKMKQDAGSSSFKRSRVLRDEHQLMHEDGTSDEQPHNSNRDDGSQEPGELRPSKMFKCWSCLKVFRSNAGLYRHVNMYHNPEKPYACDICHKRFHTNFKVWTHCQTQHGVVQNPAPSSSSYSVLDEKFQRKLIDIVREREIKKALIMKLRRNKQGLQAQTFAKKNRRSRTYGCSYCGKMFFFQSHFKLHMKVHTTERAAVNAQEDDGGLQERQDQTRHIRESLDKDVFPCRLCNEKLSSFAELEDHERACRYATVCPYCGLRFSSTLVKKDHEAHCKYKKLTCLECMRTFKSSFSIWRHQVEVHNQNIMTAREQLTQGHQDASREASHVLKAIPPPSQEPVGQISVNSREEAAYSDSSAPANFDSEDSSSYMPEDLSACKGELTVKEEPEEAAVTDREQATGEPVALDEPGVWPCEKCGKLFSSHKDLERHQELLCHIKPFICHICHKAFRTNFRLWSHYQSHMSTFEDSGSRQVDRQPPSPSSPSPPLIIALQEPQTSRASPPNVTQSAATGPEEEPRQSKSPVSKPSMSKPKRLEREKSENGGEERTVRRSDSTDKPVTSQEPDTLFYHAPTLSALTFKRQYMCKLCHRTFKTAFSLWSHEQSHSHL